MPPGFDYEVCVHANFSGSHSDPGACDRRLRLVQQQRQFRHANACRAARASEAAPEPAPAKAAPGKSKSKAKAEKAAPQKSGKASKGPKSEAEISAELNTVGHKLAAQAARTVMPSKASKEVRKDGKDYVASYVEVDATNLTTELRPGAKGQYVGFIRYLEKVYECRGASKKEALSAPCQQVRTRRLNELIRYDGKAWQF